MNSPVRQHWAPRVYLNLFATAATRLAKVPQTHILDLKSGDEFVTAIANVSVQKHLYTLGRDEANPSFVVERTLSLIEGAAAGPLKSMAAGEPVHCVPKYRMLVSYFLATLITRNPMMMAEQKRGFEALANDPLTSLPEHMRADDYRQASMVINNWYQALEDDGQHAVFLKFLTDTASPIASELRKKDWCLFQAEESAYISSDNPVVVYHPREVRYGVGTPGVSLYIALSPKVMLMLTDTGGAREAVLHNAPPRVVTTMNHLIASRAKRFAISATSFLAIKGDLMAGRSRS
jgi:hypothetical protein